MTENRTLKMGGIGVVIISTLLGALNGQAVEGFALSYVALVFGLLAASVVTIPTGLDQERFELMAIGISILAAVALVSFTDGSAFAGGWT